MARIKEKTLVTLTVHRGGSNISSGGGSASGGGGDHVYDEIFYSDLSQQSQHSLSQQDENTPLNMATYPRPRGTGGRTTAINTVDESQRYHRHPPPLHPAPTSPAPPPPVSNVQQHQQQHQQRSTRSLQRVGHPPHHAPHKPPQGMEKGSKDSGLSSGSSTHQEGGGGGGVADNSRHAFLQHGGKSNHRRQGSQGSQGSHPGGSQWVEQCSNERCRIEGSYEFEVSLGKRKFGGGGIVTTFIQLRISPGLHLCCLAKFPGTIFIKSLCVCVIGYLPSKERHKSIGNNTGL